MSPQQEQEMNKSNSLTIPNGHDDDAPVMTSAPNGTNHHHQASYHVRWTRLHKSVEIKDQVNGLLQAGTRSISASMSASKLSKMGITKTILDNVSGEAVPGEILALMGPSGSGKTTLLNVLAGRASVQDGVLSFNGQVLGQHALKQRLSKIAYVRQSDVFFEHLSVKDQLTYTALLRLPSSVKDKHAEVDRLIRLLRLQAVEDSPIKMISGGEKKRVNIGTELLTDPSVVLLDEPTSGLDSASAVSLLKLLRTLAQDQCKTIVTSIHQPSSAVFAGFDKLLMLSEGHTVFFGKPSESLEYLASHGFLCPPGYNAADHWMDLLVTDRSVEEERRQEAAELETTTTVTASSTSPPTGELRQRRGEQSRQMASPRFQLQNNWDNETIAARLEQAVDDDAASESSDHEVVGSKYPTPWWTQYRILTHRALKNSRSAIFTVLNLTKSVAIGIVVGLLWFQMPYTEANVSDIRSYYFFTMTYWVFDSMFTALMSFPTEREVVLKERASASYRLSAYFASKTTSDAPVRLILPLLYMIVSFWMAGFDNRFSVFIGTVGCTLLSVLAGEAIGLAVGAIWYDMQMALTVMTVFALALMLLGGFFVQNVPVWIIWARFLSPFLYSFNASLQLIFTSPVPCDGSGALAACGGADTGSVPASDVLASMKVEGSVAFNVGLLLVICFVPRYIAYVALRFKKAGERS